MNMAFAYCPFRGRYESFAFQANHHFMMSIGHHSVNKMRESCLQEALPN